MGPWIFASVVVIAVIGLSINYPAFRKWFFGGLTAVFATGVVAFFINNRLEIAQRERRETLVRPWELLASNLRLSVPTGSLSMATITGDVKNNSEFTVESFEFNIRILRCEAENVNCLPIYTKIESKYLKIPPAETRKLNVSFFADDLPTLDKWIWDMAIIKVTTE